MSNAGLCQGCRTISFGSLFKGSGDHYEYASKETKLGTLRRIWSETSCQFCGLVKYTFETHWGKKPVEVTLLSDACPIVYMYWGPLDVYHDDSKKSASNDIPYYIDFGLFDLTNDEFSMLRAERLGRNYDASVISNPRVIALRNNQSTGKHPQHFGRTVQPDVIDWSILKDWLASCSSKHSNDKLVNLVKLEDQLELRVIDVCQACVVILPRGAHYIALSYVWGKDQALKLKRDNESFLSTAGCFNNRRFCPSRTIIDAMQAVRYLGFRYLWVDALCIVQDDVQNVQANVGQMCRIYSEALLTIVAAAGSDADHGIPGVSPELPRSIKQKRVTIQGVTISNRLYSDEHVLLLRLLFHTSYEGTHFTAFDIASRLDERNNVFEVYALAVSEYTKRSITNPMDKVRAFDGILGRLYRPFKCPFFFGLPVSMFDIALLWMPVGPCTRENSTFPSWSWAGWNGAVAYDYIETDTLTNLCEHTVSQCSIKTIEADIEICHSATPVAANITLMEDQNNWTRHYDDEASEIYYQFSDYRLSEKESRSYRYPRQLWLSPVLRIQGQVARLRLTGQHSGSAGTVATCRNDHHVQCNLAILDAKGRAAGRVLVDARTVPQLQNREHGFLALSRSTLYRNDMDISWDEQSKTFKSWVDAPNPEKEGIQEAEYEEYIKPFENWIAGDLSAADGYTINSGSNFRVDRSNVFKKDYDGPQENRGPFDARYYSEKVFWPLFNVLLLSEEKNGRVERRGIGQVHIDAFQNGKEEEILLR
ncbi:heterokaryon incompatibility protein-domain-containing protein [Annulohypoxylon truncatum]|uniref:heterokaryon incompatibility protein-domain-containing protein n=1 Tax=Annulohypoxylon truncatum TaxID=327061 RepID=UPI0020084590|nr:heterokaryon incompatibility protein-domain-containing protein [Annulohypoxylon truncatum]KAI1210265.1 heterokaryon incompatibility protein-domain-containing protein [Annulohypoxylon truncatum]